MIFSIKIRHGKETISFSLEAMAAAISCLILLLFSSVRVVAQFTDGLGFISLDCGIESADAYYVAPRSGITYKSDADYIDAGINSNISAAYATVTLPQRYLTLRSFPGGGRRCYTFERMIPGAKYLVRPTFFYGNYDGNNSSSIRFDLHLGVSFWTTVNITDPATPYNAEIIAEAADDLISVCLVDTGHGTPFISSLEVRPLNITLYPPVSANLSLVLSSRFDLGRASASGYVRFPTDRHDRIWDVFNETGLPWSHLSTNITVRSSVDDRFEAPPAVMQTAVVAANSTKLEIFLPTDPAFVVDYYAVLYFSELQQLLKNESREFFVYFGGNLSNDAKSFSPDYLSSSFLYSSSPRSPSSRFSISLVATSNSTLPPMLNAVEVFQTMPNTVVPSDSRDVKKNWMGDPCVPKAYAWDGLNCTLDAPGIPKITAVNLSSSGLNGEISAAFANLSDVQSLDLSNNQLRGGIPDFLGHLPALKFLNLSNNQLTGIVPSALLARSQNRTLTLSIDGNPNICPNATSCETKSKKRSSTTIIVVSCVVPAMLLAIIAVFLCMLIRKKRARDGSMWQNEYTLPIQTKRFTYTEVKRMTRNFERILGRGAFGVVYHGILEDGEVAIKMLSHTSSEEFVAEAQHLSRVHHKNLVVMIGYCIERDHLALVYEYMSQGTLKDHLKGLCGASPLSWDQRLRIALEAAQGLEYLHTACKPPLIHRDVKTANILLNERLQAKISDFGLSKSFENEEHSHVSTRVVGTPGYLDPEYSTNSQLSEKSDVYSFGVVLLELISGRPPIIRDPEMTNIVPWARSMLAEGKIEEVVDQTLDADAFDVNSAWKMALLALSCADHSSSKRPTMSQVVIDLKERLALHSTPHDTSSMHLLKQHHDENRFGSCDFYYYSSISDDGPSAR